MQTVYTWSCHWLVGRMEFPHRFPNYFYLYKDVKVGRKRKGKKKLVADVSNKNSFGIFFCRKMIKDLELLV
jgi:hypothetical protein